MNIPQNLPKTPKNIRLSLIFSDKNFIKDANNLHEVTLSYLLKLEIIKKPDEFFSCSREQLKALKNKNIIDEYDRILSKYQIKDRDFWSFFDAPGSKYPTKMAISNADLPITIVMNENNKYLTINIHPFISRQEWIESWKSIKNSLKALPGYAQPRGPENLNLLYAVFNAKKEGGTWKEITEQVNEDRLNNYNWSKGSKKIWTEPELRQYYSDYKKYVSI